MIHIVKILFVKKDELEGIINKSLKLGDKKSEIIYNEDIYDEQVLLKKGNKVSGTLAMEEVMSILEENEDITISSYDVYEVGDFGEGFAFNIS